LVFELAALEFVDTTLDALDGDVELTLLALADFTLSKALFYEVLAPGKDGTKMLQGLP
jgi:hypothetical protein